MVDSEKLRRSKEARQAKGRSKPAPNVSANSRKTGENFRKSNGKTPHFSANSKPSPYKKTYTKSPHSGNSYGKEKGPLKKDNRQGGARQYGKNEEISSSSFKKAKFSAHKSSSPTNYGDENRASEEEYMSLVPQRGERSEDKKGHIKNMKGFKNGSRATAKKRDTDEGRTLFVRNLPFDVTDEEFEEVFRQRGEILYAKLVKHKMDDSMICKGVGFVKYQEKEKAEKVIRIQETLSSPSDFVSGEGADLEKEHSFIEIRGRILKIAMAVDPSKLPNEETGGDMTLSERKLTKRNAHLLCIGHTEPASEIYHKLDNKEKLRRKKSWSERNLKLQSNPNASINPFCVCLSNLPVNLTEAKMKEIISHAILSLQYAQSTDNVIKTFKSMIHKDSPCEVNKKGSDHDNKQKEKKKKKIPPTDTDGNSGVEMQTANNDGNNKIGSKFKYVPTSEKLPFPKVRLVKDKNTNKSKGYCFCQFAPNPGSIPTPKLTLDASHVGSNLTLEKCLTSFLPKAQNNKTDKIFCLALFLIAYFQNRGMFKNAPRTTIAQFSIDDKRALQKLAMIKKSPKNETKNIKHKTFEKKDAKEESADPHSITINLYRGPANLGGKLERKGGGKPREGKFVKGKFGGGTSDKFGDGMQKNGNKANFKLIRKKALKKNPHKSLKGYLKKNPKSIKKGKRGYVFS